MNDLPGYDHWHHDFPELSHLISQMRRGTHKDAMIALDRVREQEWLFDGQMQGADLRFASLHRADLRNADLRNSTFRFAKLNHADLTRADLRDANLRRANLGNAILTRANLTDTALDRATLDEANLSFATLSQANLSHALLRDTNLTGANLREANFENARFGGTILANVDLSEVNGLDTIVHERPSFVDYYTLSRSRGQIPDSFLRGVGFSEPFIEQIMPLFRGVTQRYPVFISHGHADKEFAQRLYRRLLDEGVRCWLDLRERQAKDHDHQSMSVFGKVIVCCSRNSIGSLWVQDELEMAHQNEQNENARSMFLPVDIDGCVLRDSSPGSLDIKRWLAADMTNWKDTDAFEDAFAKLVTALNIHRIPDPEP